jgi:hypothetical protein
MSRIISTAALRKSPSGKIEEGCDRGGILTGIVVGDLKGGVMVISIAGVATVAGFLFFLSLFDGFVGEIFEAGWKHPLRVFILNAQEGCWTT